MASALSDDCVELCNVQRNKGKRRDSKNKRRSDLTIFSQTLFGFEGQKGGGGGGGLFDPQPKIIFLWSEVDEVKCFFKAR